MSVYTTDPAISSGNLVQSEVHLYGSSRLGIFEIKRNVQTLATSNYLNNINTFVRGNKFFELSNHLGNVLVTVSDKKLAVDSDGNGVVDYYNADVVTASDYYPFGQQMPGRKYSQANTKYRYGFNGKENDNDVKGEGNQQDFGMRIYDNRLGRFLSLDPRIKEFPSLSPYSYAANNPIIFIDEEGAGPKPAYDKTLGKRLSQIGLQRFVDVLERCNNSSMRAFEAWGWSPNPSNFSNDKVKGLMGEAIVVDYLSSLIIFTNEKKSQNGRGTLAPQYIPEALMNQNIKVGGWDDDKSVDISFKLDLGNKLFNKLGVTMPFNNADGSQINKGKGENYLKDVNFIIEVKTGSSINNFEKGFAQALKKSQGVANAVPVVTMDDDAYKNAINASSTFKSRADQFTKNGGRIMLIDGLNESAEKAAKEARQEVKKGKNPYELTTGH